jgi:hypothetical protein
MLASTSCHAARTLFNFSATETSFATLALVVLRSRSFHGVVEPWSAFCVRRVVPSTLMSSILVAASSTHSSATSTLSRYVAKVSAASLSLLVLSSRKALRWSSRISGVSRTNCSFITHLALRGTNRSSAISPTPFAGNHRVETIEPVDTPRRGDRGRVRAKRAQL